jgi:cAMP-dependent protein kinase regulator
MGSKSTKPIPDQNLRKSTFKQKSVMMNKLILDQTLSAEAKIINIVKEKNRDFEYSNLIDTCLSRHFFIGKIEIKSRSEIIREMSVASVPANTLVFKQGDIGKYFYIIKSGEVIIENSSFSKKLGPGESFGELALLNESARSANCRSTKDRLFYVLERRIFTKIIEHINFINYEINSKFIQSIPMLSIIETDQKAILCSNLLRQIYRDGDYIVKQSEKG